jgi:hypothetical protein
MATPITPSNRIAISSIRDSAFFQSKSLPLSVGVGLSSPEARIAITAAAATNTVAFVKRHARLQFVPRLHRPMRDASGHF